MKKRSFFMILALSAMLSLAVVSPSQAASTLVTTTASFSISAPPGTTAQDFEFQFTPVDAITGLSIVSTNLPGATIVEGAANRVDVDFSAATSGNVVFSFMTNANPATVGLVTFFLTDTSNPVTTAQLNVNISAVGVPEPASMAMLGIGMTGLLVFRRFRKRAAV